MNLTRRSLLLGCCAGAHALLPGTVHAWRPRPRPRPETIARNQATLKAIAESESPSVKWKWIVVHHTAAEHASLEGIDRYHRNHFGDPLGAEYHFVIGNGRKAPAGLIQAARWRHDARAAHLFHPERAPDSLALCLVGNFEKRPPSGAELAGLSDLTRALMDRFDIPVERVTTHRGVDRRLTQCPGRQFPTRRFLAGLGPLD